MAMVIFSVGLKACFNIWPPAAVAFFSSAIIIFRLSCLCGFGFMNLRRHTLADASFVYFKQFVQMEKKCGFLRMCLL